MSESTGNPPPGGEQPPQDPYGQPPGHPPQQQSPYGQQPAYGQQPQYGGYGHPGADPDKRPGTVTAAGVITLVFSGLSLALFAVILLFVGIARDEFSDEIRDQLANEPGFENIDSGDIVSFIVVVLLVFLVWSAIAFVLAIFAMRRSNGARIGLVVSSALVAVLSLIGITSGLSAVTLIAAVAVIICLFAGGAGQWYAGKHGGPTRHGMSPPVA